MNERAQERLRRRRPGGPSILVGLRGVVLTTLATAALAGATSSRAVAAGKLVDLHAALMAGGMTGGGSGKPDLYEQTAGAAFAADVGIRLLVLDFSIRFQQMVDSNGAGGALVSGLLGPMVEIPLPGDILLRPSLAGGLVFGTLVPVDPPLTNEQLAGKGLLGVARFAVERMFGPVLGVGGQVEGGYHYLLGASGVANGKDTSSGGQFGAFATVTVHLGI